MTSRERRTQRLIEFYAKWGPVVQEHADNDTGCSEGNSFFNFHDRVLGDVIETFPRNKTQIEYMIFIAMEYLLEQLDKSDNHYDWAENFRLEWSQFKHLTRCYWG